VCSMSGGPIDEIAEAIEQLAVDARREIPAQELTTRLAGIWSMMSDLDPELARRQRKYTGPAE
jgi:hypothetical protein